MYVKINNALVEKYPYTIGDLKVDNPNTSFSSEIKNEVLSEFNVYPVQSVKPPNFNAITQTLKEENPQYINNEWVQSWSVINATEKEIEERIVKQEQNYSNAIQLHIDATAQARQYSDGISLASYDSSTNPIWAAEAQTFIAWRDAVWAYAFTELEKVKNGTRPQPSIEELLAELPVISWP